MPIMGELENASSSSNGRVIMDVMDAQRRSSSGHNITIPYLHRMISYTDALLSRGNGDTNDINLISDSNVMMKGGEHGEQLVNELARKLLVAADPSNLISSLAVPSAFLPLDDASDCKDDDMQLEDDEDSIGSDCTDGTDDDENTSNKYPPYKNTRRFKGGKARDPTRVDALRLLLRALAPVALDVATRASCFVLMTSRRGANANDDKGERARLQSFVLFGYWMPLAPQLAIVVSDLFGEFQRIQDANVEKEKRGNGCPLAMLSFVSRRMRGSTLLSEQRDKEHTTLEAQEAVVASEAACSLLDVYCFKRCEGEFVRQWWDWDTSLFILVHAADGALSNEPTNVEDVMDVEGDVIKDLTFYIGGYSPETNASHCIHWKDTQFQMKWYAARAVGALFSLRPLPLSNFLKQIGVYESDVPFASHPWKVHEEETTWERNLLENVASVVLTRVGSRIMLESSEGEANGEAIQQTNYVFQLPSIEDIRQIIPMHPSLIHVGKGILIPRRGSVASHDQWCQSSLTHSEDESKPMNDSSCFIPTETTMRNMSLLGIAMSSDPQPPPILVCGPSGSGKSSLVREMARLCSSFASSSLENATNSANYSCQEDELLELHVDDETDSKTLLGSYVATDIPGEFVWRAGPLTSAARLGRWVLIEDVDRCSEEIQAALLRLFEERILPLGVGKEERCHPRFRLFGTCATSASHASNDNDNQSRRMAAMSVGVGGKRILQPSLWRKVHVDPLPFAELKMVARQLHPDLPHSVADAVLGVLRKLDKSGRNDDSSDDMEDLLNNQSERTNNHDNILGHGARHASVREYIKLLSRISAALDFEPGSEYATESQRLICLAETVDVFAMACPFVERRRDFIGQVAAPIWGLTTDAAIRYIENRIPSVSFGGHNNRNVEIGRARLVAMKAEDDGMGDDISTPGKRHNFAEINHALRLMESIAVCVSANEPALLVGETGEWLFILQELQLLSVYGI